MLVSNKSIIDLKILSETEASHRLQKSEVCSGRGTGRGTQGDSCSDAGVRRFHKAIKPVSFGDPLPRSLCPCSPAPKVHPKAESSAYRRENLFLNALIVLAIMGAIFFTAGFLGS